MSFQCTVKSDYSYADLSLLEKCGVYRQNAFWNRGSAHLNSLKNNRMITRKDEVEAENSAGFVARVREWERVAREAHFKLTRMAALCSISERQLERMFKRYLNCTPSQWLRELQCRLARDLVAQGYTSKAAAAELKFATDAHFCREFKKVFGTSPQTFAPNRLAYLSLAGLDLLGRAVRETGELGAMEAPRLQGTRSDGRLYAA